MDKARVLRYPQAGPARRGTAVAQASFAPWPEAENLAIPTSRLDPALAWSLHIKSQTTG
jgi:hypothetical protein